MCLWLFRTFLITSITFRIQNLKRIVPEISTWAKIDGAFYDQQNELYDQVYGQFSRYIGHVTANIGGVKEDFKTHDQGGEVGASASMSCWWWLVGCYCHINHARSTGGKQ